MKADREAREAATEEKRRQFLKREIEWVRRGALARTTKQKARLRPLRKIKEYGENPPSGSNGSHCAEDAFREKPSLILSI